MILPYQGRLIVWQKYRFTIIIINEKVNEEERFSIYGRISVG